MVLNTWPACVIQSMLMVIESLKISFINSKTITVFLFLLTNLNFRDCVGKAGSLILSTLYFLVLVKKIQDKKIYPLKLYNPLTPKISPTPIDWIRRESRTHFCNDQHIFKVPFMFQKKSGLSNVEITFKNSWRKRPHGFFWFIYFFKGINKGLESKMHLKCKVLVQGSFGIKDV